MSAAAGPPLLRSFRDGFDANERFHFSEVSPLVQDRLQCNGLITDT